MAQDIKLYACLYTRQILVREHQWSWLTETCVENVLPNGLSANFIIWKPNEPSKEKQITKIYPQFRRGKADVRYETLSFILNDNVSLSIPSCILIKVQIVYSYSLSHSFISYFGNKTTGYYLFIYAQKIGTWCLSSYMYVHALFVPSSLSFCLYILLLGLVILL